MCLPARSGSLITTGSMSEPETSREPTLFDATYSEPADQPPSAAADEPAERPLSREELAANERKRLAEQLDALKRKELELRRALAAAEHPELAEPIRLIASAAFAVSRAEGKLAQGLSKTEARRSAALEKKLGTLREKRAELDSQIRELETELGTLGADRFAEFEGERKQALEQLVITLGMHDAGLRAAGLSSSHLVPEIEGWMPELEALATSLSAVKSPATE